MFVAIGDHGQIGVVGFAAAGHHRVQQLAGFAAGQDAVGGVDRDALGGVDGGGVAELDVLGDVVGRQGNPASGTGVGDVQAAVGARVDHLPAVTVLHEIGGAGPQATMVAAGEDGVPGAGGQPVGQPHLPARGCAVEALVAGAGVEFSDQLAGGGEHDRIQTTLPVGAPGGEHVGGHGGQVADVDTLLVEVEAECFGASSS